MKCPHCLLEVNPCFTESYLGEYEDKNKYSIYSMHCPNNKCRKLILKLANVNRIATTMGERSTIISDNIIYPLNSGRTPAATEVEPQFAEDYNEACLILPFSPKASAALSRRCLQNIIRIKENIKKKNLMLEIDELISLNKLPSFLSDNLQTIRGFGNIAAHGMEDQVSGQILDVEPEEADFLLDILELMFDFYFVQPAKAAKIKAVLNQKLSNAGKPTI
ncbi:DUF4145 domain-containing protein [Bacteroides sp. 14(A)]|uniref:DUF4145 domain-containing protein n=1 Tax=Bacteroides sp. 14(A) TaxID=1163670 RepID=UPI000470A720|nr:DUF4145 domain-containing protein [Bacteroides sp. 14(A)]